MKNIKNYRFKMIYFTVFFMLIIFGVNYNVKATVTSSGADHPNYTYYSDGVYEYMAGLNFVMSNSPSDPYFYYSPPRSTSLGYSDSISQVLTDSNLRDRSTYIQDNASGLNQDWGPGDRRGWQFDHNEWFTFAGENKYIRNVGGFNEYVADYWYPSGYANVIEGVQNGGDPKAYWSGSAYNQYRRAVFMVYRRPLPYVSQDSAYINSIDLSTGGNVYRSASTLWIPANKSMDMRTISCVIRGDADGQNAQYSENVQNNYIFARSSDSSIWLELYTDGRNGVGANSYGWYNGHSTGWQYLKSASVFQKYEYGNAIQWNTYKRNGLESSAIYAFPDNEDITWKFDAADKYGIRQSAYYTTFWYNSNPYTTLSTDGTPPTGNNVRVANVTATGYDVYVDNVKDTRSGVRTVKFPTWTNNNGQDDITWADGVNDGNGTWHYHVDKALHNNEVTGYNTHVYAYDNVGNSSFLGGIGTDLYILNATLTNDIPATMLSGNTYTVHVTATNTGTVPWSEANYFRLGGVGDSDPFAAARQYIAAGTTVSPGQSYTFTINMKAPNVSTITNYVSDWQMIKEGVTWFGGQTSQTVKVINPVPFQGSLSVIQYDYKQGNNNYWVKPNSIIGVYTDGYFPSNYGIYPTRTYVLLAKDGLMNINTSARQSADIYGSYTYGSEYSTYFNMLNGAEKAQQFISNGNNYIGITHHLTAKLDGTKYKMFYTTTYINGSEYYSGYIDSGIWLNVDGTAPTGNVNYNYNPDTAQMNLNVSNVIESGSGVNKIWAEYSPIDNPANIITKNLSYVNGVYQDSENLYSMFSGNADTVNIKIKALDNVGNQSTLSDTNNDVFMVKALIARVLTPNDNNFKSGEKGVLKISVYGGVDTLKITFPTELSTLDGTLNKTLTLAPKVSDSVNFEFFVPLEAPSKGYNVEVKAFKKGNSRVVYPVFNVNGSILDNIRTRIKIRS